MTTEKTTAEKVSVEKAINHVLETCSRITDRVTQLETQVKEIHKISNHRYEEISIALPKLRDDLSSQVEQIQAQTKEWHVETASKLEEYQRLLKVILHQLEILNKEELPTQLNLQRPYTIQTNDSILMQPNLNTTQQPTYVENHETQIPRNVTAAPVSHTVVIPPSSAIPVFSGKLSERPNQFLIRVQEYAETVHGWDHLTLLNDISQFLRDTALEWYCQLRISYRRPQTWSEFVNLFPSQFDSPIRSARQEQEWYECKQRENETINAFVVRLRALWVEQKPKETEVDLIRHLFCKMRNDLLGMIGVPRGASLDEIIYEA